MQRDLYDISKIINVPYQGEIITSILMTLMLFLSKFLIQDSKYKKVLKNKPLYFE